MNSVPLHTVVLAVFLSVLTLRVFDACLGATHAFLVAWLAKRGYPSDATPVEVDRDRILPHERVQVAATLLAAYVTQRPQEVDAVMVTKSLIDADLLIAIAESDGDDVDALESAEAPYVPPAPTGVYPSEVYVPNLGDVQCATVVDGERCLLTEGHDGDHKPVSYNDNDDEDSPQEKVA